jgi:hypothetical protein
MLQYLVCSGSYRMWRSCREASNGAGDAHRGRLWVISVSTLDTNALHRVLSSLITCLILLLLSSGMEETLLHASFKQSPGVLQKC